MSEFCEWQKARGSSVRDFRIGCSPDVLWVERTYFAQAKDAQCPYCSKPIRVVDQENEG